MQVTYEPFQPDYPPQRPRDAAPPRAPEPRPPASPSRAIVLFLCLLVGALLAGFGHELQRYRQAQEQLSQSASSRAVLITERNQQAELLTDPRSRQVELTAVRGAQTAASATIAWLAPQRTGVLVTSRLPAPSEGSHYELWAYDEAGQALRVATVNAPATEVKTFHSAAPVEEPRSFELIEQPSGATTRPTGNVIFRGVLY